MIKPTASLLQADTDITARYRITSRVRRRPYTNLFFAIDTQQSRPVAIRDIDITSLDNDGRIRACEIVQQEYDLLRRERIATILPVIDMRHFEGHLSVISGWPLNTIENNVHLHTLQDALQSGVGLPNMQMSLSWIEQLCLSLDHLHRHNIVLGDLDPQTLILASDQYDGTLELMVSWLPPAISTMLPDTSPMSNTSNYSAPEVLLGKAEPRSDIYSLGAVLYILLTGMPPDEATARMHRRLRSPSEVNPRIPANIEEFVMQALALESEERFPDARTMADSLLLLRTKKRLFSKSATPLPPAPVSENRLQPDPTPVQVDDSHASERTIDEIIHTNAVQNTPLPPFPPDSWQTPLTPATSLPPTPPIVEEAVQQYPASTEDTNANLIDEDDDEDEPLVQRPNNNTLASSTIPPTPMSARGFKQRITGILPAISPPLSRPKVPQAPKAAPSREVTIRPPRPPSQSIKTPFAASSNKTSLLKQLQQIVLGEQKHSTAAAAIIETPLRVQPQQAYTIRIQLMGRNIPLLAGSSTSTSGLSALVEGKLVHIEVRSALYQNYAYIVQQAAVHIPAVGFAAEVTIPMKPLSGGPSGRRDRLHIFFMDEQRHPLYEKPFVLELFISNLVQPGREGHNVLTIPL
ncbi:MAG: serine/threonine protein kinase [Ktedonobacteraceae bacterium]